MNKAHRWTETSFTLRMGMDKFINDSMRILSGLGVVSLSLLFLSAGAVAEEAVARKISVDHQVAAEMIEAWTVEPFARVNGTMSGECIMRADYSNGFELAFKGKQNRLTALRVTDVNANDDAVVKGFIGLGIGDNSYGLQSKAREGRVDASLLTVPSAGELIRNMPLFNLRMGDANYAFSSAGFDDGYEQLITCQRQYGLTTLKVVDDSRPIIIDKKVEKQNKVPAAPKLSSDVALGDKDGIAPLEPIAQTMENGKNSVPLAMALPMLLPAGYSYQFDGTVNAMAPVSWDAKGDWKSRLNQAASGQGYVVDVKGNTVKISNVLTPVSVAKRKAVPVEMNDEPMFDGEWRAEKGDSLVNTLNVWANKAGVETDIRLDNDPALKHAFFMNGSFEMAVNTLLNRVSIGTAVKPSAVITGDNGAMTSVSGYQGGVLKTAPKDVTNTNGKRWRALEGTDLRKVLMQWSETENITLIWDTDNRFLVRNNVKTTVPYAEAVSMILAQYQGQSVRPVAKLNTDPKTNETALVIQVEKK